MKKLTTAFMIAIVGMSFMLSGCSDKKEASVEVDDKLLGGQEVEIKTPDGGEAEIDIPKVDVDH